MRSKRFMQLTFHVDLQISTFYNASPFPTIWLTNNIITSLSFKGTYYQQSTVATTQFLLCFLRQWRKNFLEVRLSQLWSTTMVKSCCETWYYCFQIQSLMIKLSIIYISELRNDTFLSINENHWGIIPSMWKISSLYFIQVTSLYLFPNKQ